jgi:hypothetical protein
VLGPAQRSRAGPPQPHNHRHPASKRHTLGAPESAHSKKTKTGTSRWPLGGCASHTAGCGPDSPRLLDEFRHKGGPACLVAGAQPRAIVPVHVLKEGHRIPPSGIPAEVLHRTIDGSARPPNAAGGTVDPVTSSLERLYKNRGEGNAIPWTLGPLRAVTHSSIGTRRGFASSGHHPRPPPPSHPLPLEPTRLPEPRGRLSKHVDESHRQLLRNLHPGRACTSHFRGCSRHDHAHDHSRAEQSGKCIVRKEGCVCVCVCDGNIDSHTPPATS